MQVRLAFAVAAHLEPEILIIDEVLAVGDAEFQKKCLGKMQDVAKEGRTVLFVSHNLYAVTTLTTRAILLEKGLLSLNGPTTMVVDNYGSNGASHLPEWKPSFSIEDKSATITRVRLLNIVEKLSASFSGADSIIVDSNVA